MKTYIAALLLVALGQLPVPPTPLQRIDTIQQQLDALRIELTPAPPPVIPAITTEVIFDARVAGAIDGDDITLGAAFVYTKAFTAHRAMTIHAEVIPADIPAAADVLPSFQDGIIIATGTNDVTLRGLEMHKVNPVYPVLEVQAGTARITIDRNRIAGDGVKGARKCIVGNAAFLSVTHNDVRNCFGPYPGNDTQALNIYDTPGPGEVRGNYFEGGTEVLMFGGSDSNYIPSDYVIVDNTFAHRAEQQFLAISVKNLVEFKNARRILFEGNRLFYSWGGHGQTGYVFAITPRNQSGGAPQSTVEDLTIRNNDAAHAAGAFTILSGDDRAGFPSGRLTRLTLTGNRFTDLDPTLYSGDNKVILVASSAVSGSSIDTLIDGNTFAGKNIGSWLYFTTLPQHENMVITNNAVPVSKYGVFSNVGAQAATWAKFVLSGQLANNVITQ